jgi:glycosidase
VPTWFDSKADLLDLIESAHTRGLQMYADLVFNHNGGADVEISSVPTAQIHYQPGAAPRE